MKSLRKRLLMSLTSARKIGLPGRRDRNVEPTPRPHGGDELRDLAETFRVTVDRLSSLVRQLEAAHQREMQVEADKKRFYRDVIRAVTGGKLELADREEIPRFGEPIQVLSVTDGEGYAAARRAIRAIAEGAGMAPERADDLVLAAGEAITNTMKHASDGTCEIYRDPETIYVRVVDRGAGIGSQVLPQAILMPGFSTKVSLGMGYKMVLRLCDKVWLATGPEGTLVQMAKRIHPSPEDAFPEGLLDRI